MKKFVLIARVKDQNITIENPLNTDGLANALDLLLEYEFMNRPQKVEIETIYVSGA